VACLKYRVGEKYLTLVFMAVDVWVIVWLIVGLREALTLPTR